MRLVVLGALCLAGCASHPGGAAPPSPRESFGLPAATAPLVFPPEAAEVTLAWLAVELARLTGQELALAPETRTVLEATAEPLELTTPVPAEEVYPFVEGLLASQDFFVVPLKGGARPILLVLLARGARSLDVGTTVSVSRAELPELARHPALLCQLVLSFENIDSRQLQTQLRQLLVDAGGLQVVPAGERSLILQGPGARLHGLGRLLLEIDRATATGPRADAPPLGPRS